MLTIANNKGASRFSYHLILLSFYAFVRRPRSTGIGLGLSNFRQEFRSADSSRPYSSLRGPEHEVVGIVSTRDPKEVASYEEMHIDADCMYQYA